jgi:hypothetical protein
LPQPPQFFGSLANGVSQPSPANLSQSPQPASHEPMPHAPPLHAAVAWAGVVQIAPQPPQFVRSLCVFAQIPPGQQLKPFSQKPFGPQPPTHTPAEHVWPARQVLPHAPQLFGSSVRLASQPSADAPLQLAKSFAQALMTHWLAWQVTLACGSGVQAFPHAPQLFGSDCTNAHEAPQQSSPAPQAAPSPQKPTHWKLEQTSSAAHCEVSVHSTHTRVSSRQCGVGAAHSASLVQPVGFGTHWWLTGSHAWPVGHVSGDARHATHLPAGTSQYGVAGVVTQSALL